VIIYIQLQILFADATRVQELLTLPGHLSSLPGYNWGCVVQLQDDNTVAEGSAALAGKHFKNSTLI
jgi:hypothetical protein